MSDIWDVVLTKAFKEYIEANNKLQVAITLGKKSATRVSDSVSSLQVVDKVKLPCAVGPRRKFNFDE